MTLYVFLKIIDKKKICDTMSKIRRKEIIVCNKNYDLQIHLEKKLNIFLYGKFADTNSLVVERSEAFKM